MGVPQFSLPPGHPSAVIVHILQAGGLSKHNLSGTPCTSTTDLVYDGAHAGTVVEPATNAVLCSKVANPH